MNIIKCPDCNSEELMTYDTKGCIQEGRIIEEMECLDCDCNFAVKAKLSNIEIEKE